MVCDEAQLKAGEQVWFDCVKRGFVPRNGAVEVLSEIKNRGYKTGLITDCTAETPAIWPGTPFAQMIDVPLFSCVEGTRKPDPQLYRSACRRLNVQPSDCLYVGDGGSRELTGASRAGMHPVLINSPRDGLQDAHWLDFEDWSGPSISSLRDVLELLK